MKTTRSIDTPLVFLLGWLMLTGCSNVVRSGLVNDRSILLPPSVARTIYIQIRNTSENQLVTPTAIPARLTTKGYQIVQDPSSAAYWLQPFLQKRLHDIGWDVPWFVAQASYHVPGDEGSDDIRAAQASLWKDGIALEGPDSDALKGNLREREGKGVHFSGPGLREHGAKWAQKIIPWLQQQWTAPRKVRDRKSVV